MTKQDVFIRTVAIITVISLSILVRVTSTYETDIQKENNQRLMVIVSMNNELVESCNWDIPIGIAIKLCDEQTKKSGIILIKTIKRILVTASLLCFVA